MAICRAYLFRQAFHSYSIHRSQHSTASSQLLLNTCGRAQYSRPSLSRHLYVMSMHERQRAHVTITTSVYTRDCGHGPGVKQVQMCVPSHLFVVNVHGTNLLIRIKDQHNKLCKLSITSITIGIHRRFRHTY